MADVVFTYAPADVSRAHAIAEALKGLGVEAEWDRTLLPGERYDAVITRRLNEAKAVVVLWSANSIGSNLIMDEAALARDQGKLVPVAIDQIEPPMGFRQLQSANLAGFPSPASQAGVKSLADALAMMTSGAAPTAPPKPADWSKPAPAAPANASASDQPKLFTSGYWGWTAALGAFCGLMFFLSPEGQSTMENDVAQRFGVLIGNMLVPTLIFAAARIMLYWSRRWVGKPPGAYFTIEMAGLLIAAVLLAVANTLSPTGAPAGGNGLIGFTHQFNYAVIGVFMLATPAIFAVRGVLRLMRGKPKMA